MMRSSIATAAVLLSLGSSVHARSSIIKSCPVSNVCYSLNIPDSTSSSGSGDIYFQISAPTSYTWVALGQGTGMSGANIFVAYTSEDGQNVTVSPRHGTGYTEPQHDTTAQIEVLAGSGVSNGMMTANVKCSNCDSWSGGTMDFSGSSASWIYGYKSGPSLNSNDLEATITQHDDSKAFKWTLTNAKGGDDVNPFVAGASATTGAGSSGGSTATSTCVPRPTGTQSSSNADGVTYCDDTSGSTTFETTGPAYGGIITAHGVLASLVFVALLPTGSILIRMASFSNALWVHAIIQLVAYGIYIVAFGMGVYLATQLNYLNDHHPIIGIVLFVVLLTQPVTGFIHHKLYKKQGGRTTTSYIHLWIGRGAIFMGMINGGLGLQLAGGSKSAKIAYAVVALVVGIVYIASAVMGENKRRKGTRYYGNPNRRLDSGKGDPGISMEHFGPNKENR